MVLPTFAELADPTTIAAETRKALDLIFSDETAPGHEQILVILKARGVARLGGLGEGAVFLLSMPRCRIGDQPAPAELE